MKRVMLGDYVTDSIEQITVNGNLVEITTYQGEHQDEYLMREMKSGRCSLFYKGILQLSWDNIDTQRMSGFTVYEKGKALSRGNRKGPDGKECRYMGNSKNGLELVVEGNDVIYRGEFDSVESMQKEGRGVECDKKNGRVLRCGVWKNDELFQVIQEFEGEVMIEYEVEEGEENVSVLNRHPMYEGGYVFDETTSSYVRHGEGCEIEGGIAVREGKWEKGELVESVELFDGWYVSIEGNDVLTWGRSMEIHNWTEWQNVNERVTELVIPSNCCNESEFTSFDVSGLKWLKQIEIGDECFENVNEVKLIGLHKLERVVIGKNSFTKTRNMDPNRHFYLKDCEQLKELKMDCYSFSDFSVCEIDNLASLEVIEMGEVNEISCNFRYASLELKGDGDEMN